MVIHVYTGMPWFPFGFPLYHRYSGNLKGNVNSEKISIKKTADIEGVLNQKILAVEEGATLKIKTETYK